MRDLIATDADIGGKGFRLADCRRPHEVLPRAKWRGITPMCRHCGAYLSLTLTHFDGREEITRFVLTEEDARALRDVLTETLDSYRSACDQSDKSSGKPQAEGSSDGEGQSV